MHVLNNRIVNVVTTNQLGDDDRMDVIGIWAQTDLFLMRLGQSDIRYTVDS